MRRGIEMAHKSFIGTKLPKVLRKVVESFHGNPVKDFKRETQRLKDLRIERATGEPPPKREKPKKKKDK